MDALEMTLLYDYYGGMLTQKQRDCLDMRYNQDLSLGEIAGELGISRQAVCDNLSRTEALLRRMEENIGCISRMEENRRIRHQIFTAAQTLAEHPDESVCALARKIIAVVGEFKE